MILVMTLASVLGAFYAHADENGAGDSGGARGEHPGTIGACYVTDVYGTQCMLTTFDECQAYAVPDRDVTVDWRLSGCPTE